MWDEFFLILMRGSFTVSFIERQRVMSLMMAGLPVFQAQLPSIACVLDEVFLQYFLVYSMASLLRYLKFVNIAVYSSIQNKSTARQGIICPSPQTGPTCTSAMRREHLYGSQHLMFPFNKEWGELVTHSWQLNSNAGRSLLIRCSHVGCGRPTGFLCFLVSWTVFSSVIYAY